MTAGQVQVNEKDERAISFTEGISVCLTFITSRSLRLWHNQISSPSLYTGPAGSASPLPPADFFFPLPFFTPFFPLFFLLPFLPPDFFFPCKHAREVVVHVVMHVAHNSSEYEEGTHDQHNTKRKRTKGEQRTQGMPMICWKGIVLASIAANIGKPHN